MSTLAIWVLIFGFVTSAHAAWECTWATTESELNEEIEIDSAKHAIDVTEALLISIATHTNFDIQEVGKSVVAMNRLARNPILDNASRTKAYRVSAVLYGRVADKLQSMKSGVCGYNTFYYLKKGLELTPADRDSIVALAIGISGTCYQESFKKFFIEKNMKIKCANEATIALAAIKNLRAPVKEAFGDSANGDDIVAQLKLISEGKGPLPQEKNPNVY